jgi:PTH1 family peptidyl-tRNA hydrolase
LIVGLGNPGPNYSLTRHNAGFLALEELARTQGLSWENAKKWSCRAARLGQTFLLLPQTFMNRSGEAVAAFARFYQITPGEILVVLDDFALPFGTLRWRARGSAGGHNGLASILQQFGTSEIPRLRLGIGPLHETGSAALVPADGWADFVLSRFSSAEMAALPEFINRACAELARLLHLPSHPSSNKA